MLAISVFSSFAAGNTVPLTRIDESNMDVYPIDFLPDECIGIIPIWLYTYSGTGWVNGSGESDLMLGSDQADQFRGRDSADCIVGGDGADQIRGNQEGDIILGGDGDDELRGNRGNDVIYGGGGRDEVIGGKGYDICYGGGGGDRAQDFDCEEVYFP